MPMNKAEKQVLEDLKTRVALRWTEAVQTDVDPPERSGELAKGFLYCGEYSDHPRVEVACSSAVHHALGYNDKTTSQGPRELYSTRLRALRALRFAVEKRCALALRHIDYLIECQLKSPTVY